MRKWILLFGFVFSIIFIDLPGKHNIPALGVNLGILLVLLIALMRVLYGRK